MYVMCNEKCDAQYETAVTMDWKQKTKTNLGPSTEPCDTPWSIIQQNCLFDRICYPDRTKL